ncbi:MAG: hypothetical protein AABO41_00105 [Acidobacteriota bacterium]
MVSTLKRQRLALVTLVVVLASVTSAFAAKKFDGRWTLTITIPESPNVGNNRTFTVTIEASPRDGSLHGRSTITDAEGHTVGGAWRQVAKKVSVTYELPCAGDGPCATLILTGKIKSSGTKINNGNVIVMWDTANDHNPALFDTSNGSFKANRLE